MEKLENIKRIIQRVAKGYKPKEVWIFGSALRDYDNARDIDIGIRGTDRDFLRLSAELVMALKDKVHKRIDVVPIDWLREKKIFMECIREEGERLL